MPGKRRLDRGVTLNVTHLTDADNVRIDTQRRDDQILLCDIVGRVI